MDRSGSHQISVPTATDPVAYSPAAIGFARLQYSWKKMLFGLLVSSSILGILPSSASNRALRAGEPFNRFMDRLKEERLFDLAIVYLDQQSAAGTLTETQIAALPLERALLLQQSSIFQRTSELRTSKLAEAEAAFKEFLDKHSTHPRRGEAKLGLGNLMLSQGENNFKAGSEKTRDESKLKLAADFFKRSQELFDSTLVELTPLLNELKGARIGDGDAEKIELRDRYRNEYEQAQLLAVYARKRAADCLPVDSEERKKELAESENGFTKIYLNKTRADGLRNLALFYRGQVQKAIGKVP